MENLFIIKDKALLRCKDINYSGTVIIPEGVENIGFEAFKLCANVAEIKLPSTLKRIGNLAFYGSGITSIQIPSSCTLVEDGAFMSCPALKELMLPEGLDVISEGLVCYCESLKKVVIPSSVKTIEEGAFSGCSNLKSVVFKGVIDKIGPVAFEDCENLQEIDIPFGCKEIGYAAFRVVAHLNAFFFLIR